MGKKRMICVIGLFAAILPAIFAQNAELPRLAVVEFDVNSQQQKVKEDAITVRELVESQMIGTRKYRIITRNEIDKIMLNQRIEARSISSPESLKKLQIEKINYIITGSVNAMGDKYAVTVKMLDVSNGQFPNSVPALIDGTPNGLFVGIEELMTKFVAGMTSEGGRVTQTATNKTYKVGDFGPAGGYVFYDKGVFSNGWRYLEAAPAEFEFRAEWGAYGQDVPGTNTGVGFGKRNTEIIVERLKALGETGKAAQVCVSLNFDGYKDWFLPSKDELDLMYKNLKQRGLGGFKTAEDKTNWTHIYRSSSQYDYRSAWYQRFSDGDQSYGYYKYGTYSVRAVRAF